MPVNSVVFGDRQLRGLSMPFRPGLPLDDVIKRVDPAARPRGALALWNVLVAGTTVLSTASAEEGNDNDSVSPLADERTETPRGDLFARLLIRMRLRRVADGHAEMPRGDGWDGFPVRGTYAHGVAWIVMILARALAYAHRMRTYHRDVKPGNVLLTLQHGPQLLDFNLAESPHSVSQAEAAMHGGTLPYMAPEQIEAFLNPELWGKVGAKADIYSLGLVLRELLTGQAPDLPAQTLSPPRALRVLLDRRPMLDVSVRRANPAIPHALEAIVAKCLAVAPDARYPTAQALAKDLDHFLKRMPLAHTTNPSRPERLGNWARRRRSALATNTAYLLVLVIAGWAFGVGDRIKQWFKPPVETVSGFLDAVRMIDNAEFNRAQPLLGHFVAEYPDSFLPKLYLSFSLDAWKDNKSGASHDTELSPEAAYRAKREVEADELLKKAMATPDVHTKLSAWAQGHPDVAAHLEAAGHARFFRIERITRDPDYDQNEAELERRFLYHLTRPAVELAAELNPNSIVAPRLLAIIDEADEHFQLAYERITYLIDGPGVPGRDESELYRATMLRARLARNLADRRQDNPLAASQALKWMQQAVKDLRFSERYATALRNDETTLYVLAIKAPAFLTLSEIETDLGMIPEAKEHLRVYLDTLDQVEARRPNSFKYSHNWDLPLYREREAYLKQRLQAKCVEGDKTDPSTPRAPSSAGSQATPHR